MIKFHCPSCNQKLGVPDEYAGKRVRCTRCKEATQVPQPELPVLEEIAVAPALETGDEIGGDMSADEAFSDGMWDDFGGEEGVDAADAARQEAIAQASAPKTKIKTARAGPSQTKSSQPHAAAKYAVGAGKVPLAIGAALLFPLGAGIIWGLIARVSGFIFCWGAIPVACLAAFGLTMFMERRTLAIGLLATLFGFVGIIEGKLCIAKFAGVHELQKMVNSELEQRLGDEQLTDEQVDEMLQEEWTLYAVATIDLMEQGQFEKEFVGEMFKAHLMDEYPDELAEAIAQADEKVYATIDNWSPDRRRRMVKDKWPAVVANSAQLFMASKLGGALTMGLAFIGSFALWDLLFIPMALWAAVKIGAGHE